ncbi:hypothetical protein KR215_001672 [Drosophila sulfurigaster]|nr:hypothetical protein KR215_001672 [Drosophila sulfurigaster]
MNCLQTFLKCSQFLTDPTEIEETDEISEVLAEKCEEFLKRKHASKRRFEYIDKYMRCKIFMMEEPIPSPNLDRLLEISIDAVLSQIHV